MTTTAEVTRYLDDILETATVPDYPNALNGLQLQNSGRITKVAACVDFSGKAAQAAIDADADFLLVHHGMFWPGARPLTGPFYESIRKLLENDVAV